MKGFKREKIWDPISRLWHWLLVISVSAAWWYGENMTFATVDWHFYLGYGVLGLVLFRLLWGFVGPAPIRFRSLLHSPATIRQYLKTLGVRSPSGSPGHNPLGSLSAIILLASIAFQAVSGLFIESDDYFESAPLAKHLSEEMVNQVTGWHRLNAKILLVLVGLHLSAILFYWLWKKENLTTPMITGWKWVKENKSAD